MSPDVSAGHVPGGTCRMKPHTVRFRSGDRKSKKVIERERPFVKIFTSSKCIV